MDHNNRVAACGRTQRRELCIVQGREVREMPGRMGGDEWRVREDGGGGESVEIVWRGVLRMHGK